jgi:hypothetical protein
MGSVAEVENNYNCQEHEYDDTKAYDCPSPP